MKTKTDTSKGFSVIFKKDFNPAKHEKINPQPSVIIKNTKFIAVVKREKLKYDN